MLQTQGLQALSSIAVQVERSKCVEKLQDLINKKELMEYK